MRANAAVRMVTREQAIKRWRWPLGVFAMCLAITLLRGWQRVAMPHLWAEDGTQFLRAQLEDGHLALLKPYDGYFHLLPRVLTLVLFHLPLPLFPLGITLVSYGIWAAVAASVASDHMAHLIPSRSARLLAAMLVCLVPSLHEVGGNLANLHQSLLVSLALLTLKDPKQPLTSLDLCWVFICGATEGAAFTLVFAFAARAYVREGKIPLRFNRDYLAAAILVGCAGLTATLRETQAAVPRHFIAPSLVVDSIYRIVLERFFLTPWLSPRWPALIDSQSLVVITLAASVFVGVCFAGLWRRKDLSVLPLLLVLCALVGIYVTTWFVRPGTLDTFRYFRAGGPIHRYWFITWPFAVLLTMSSLAAFKPKWSFVFAAINAAGAASYFFIPRLDEAPPWANIARSIEAAKQGEPIDVPVNPAGWHFSYQRR